MQQQSIIKLLMIVNKYMSKGKRRGLMVLINHNINLKSIIGLASKLISEDIFLCLLKFYAMIDLLGIAHLKVSMFIVLLNYRIVLRTKPSYIIFGIKIFRLILKVVKFL